MKMLALKLLGISVIVALMGCAEKKEGKISEKIVLEKTPDFTEDWASLGNHNESPEWFKNSNWVSISTGAYIRYLPLAVNGIQDGCTLKTIKCTNTM